MKTGIELIAEEREEQLGKHGRTIEYDVATNSDGQLSRVAAILVWLEEIHSTFPLQYLCPENWDLDLFKKMAGKPYKERLVTAASLLAAEIDRLNYCDNDLSV